VRSPTPSQLPHRDPASGRVLVLIDIPAGSRNRYKYDAGLGVFSISRRLPAGLSFPHDFGFIPGTCAADGDALDAAGGAGSASCRYRSFGGPAGEAWALVAPGAAAEEALPWAAGGHGCTDTFELTPCANSSCSGTVVMPGCGARSTQ